MRNRIIIIDNGLESIVAEFQYSDDMENFVKSKHFKDNYGEYEYKSQFDSFFGGWKDV